MKNYTVELETQMSGQELYEFLLKIENWWSGIYNETIRGQSKKLDDEFTFSAGDGVHFSKHRLIELVPGTKIVWQVIESNLSFLDNPNEWDQTFLQFDILENKSTKTKLRFTHRGLVPEIECYSRCSDAWSLYFQKLKSTLQ